uniref:Uncharacterized protein n=1 Tax=Ciona intestinalis TaxID=7719 RepID=H2XP23_CIOIN
MCDGDWRAYEIPESCVLAIPLKPMFVLWERTVVCHKLHSPQFHPVSSSKRRLVLSL